MTIQALMDYLATLPDKQAEIQIATNYWFVALEEEDMLVYIDSDPAYPVLVLYADPPYDVPCPHCGEYSCP
jgi:hypothetical protein